MKNEQLNNVAKSRALKTLRYYGGSKRLALEYLEDALFTAESCRWRETAAIDRLAIAYIESK